MMLGVSIVVQVNKTPPNVHSISSLLYFSLLAPHAVHNLKDLRNTAHDSIVNSKRTIPMLDLIGMPANALRLKRAE